MRLESSPEYPMVNKQNEDKNAHANRKPSLKACQINPAACQAKYKTERRVSDDSSKLVEQERHCSLNRRQILGRQGER